MLQRIMSFRITYSVLNADLSELHREFDAVLTQTRAGFGREFPYWVGGKPRTSGSFIDDKNPADTRQLLARFHKTPVKELDEIFKISKTAFLTWRSTAWQERARIFRKAADIISERRLEIAAIMALETGKNRLESLGDVEESADLFRFHAGQLEESNGLSRAMGKLSPNENTRDVLRPYGVFVVVSPFNFPLALAAGMASGAMLAGNTVVFKPSQETPWCGQYLFEVLRAAGLPDGVMQLVYGTGSELGSALIEHPAVDGIAFTGSYDVGMDILKKFTSGRHPRPVMLEMGGKNPTIVCETANLEKAAQGCWKSAFGLTGQKCSALSRVYVHKSVKEAFLKKLVEKTAATVIGDPTDAKVFMGPLINAKALERFERAVNLAKKDGKVLIGGGNIRSGDLAHGHYVPPTIAELPANHPLFQEELFAPLLVVTAVDSLEQAIQLSNDALYGLTAGIFTERKDEIDLFMNTIEAGVLYANRESGATTGAWPGVNPFCGWKGSGASGKGICGPYYVAQYAREQSQTIME
jgi:1-pyrroline-5-carboxylate dehydrogenase